jgi:putative ABC transport system permease protein
MDPMLGFLRSVWVRARKLVHRRSVDAEFEDEMRFHLDAEVAHNVERGLSPDEARRQALVAFGGVSNVREEAREARGFPGLEAFMRDARLSLRRLRRAPAFTAGVVGTLAIALGAATGIGTLVHGVMLKPLPYPDADRLVQLAVHTPGLDIATDDHSAGTYLYVAEEARSFSALGWYSINEGVTITDGEPERVVGANLTPSVLRILGAKPVAGRLFLDDDAAPDRDGKGVLISHEIWQRRFNADPQVAGRTIELNRRSRLILGVLAPAAEAPWNRVAVYFPEVVTSSSAGLNSRYFKMIGQLAPDATLERAQQDLDLLASRMHERYPEVSAEKLREMGFRMTVQSLRDATIAPVRAELRLLAVMVGALLLIAVANVTTLALLRAEKLRGEVAVARALGASGGAVVRRFVIEGGLLAFGGAALALPLAALALSVRFGFTDAEIPRLHDINVTPAIVAGLAITSLVIGVLLGFVSSVRADGGSTAQTLRDDGRTTRGRRWRRVQASLVTVQVAFALTLLLGAGLMGMSFLRLQGVDIGFASAERTTFVLRVPWSAYRSWTEVTGFHARVEEALGQVPGVTRATAAMELPSTSQLLGIHPRLDATRQDGRVTQAFINMNVVSPSFFDVMEIPIRAGRRFEANDLAGPTPGVVLAASLARELFGEEDPVGREVQLASGGKFPPYRVVGVSGDLYGERIADGPLRVLYFPLLPQVAEGVQMPEVPAGMSFVVRSSLPVAQLVPQFRQAVASVDPRIPIWGVRTLDSIVADSMARARLTMLLLGVAALATLLLSALGLYSVIAYAVAARRREFAVRLALGATPALVRGLVMREGAVVTGLGVVLGLALTFASVRLLRSVLYEVSATDPRLFVAGTLVVLMATGIAILVPARRAAAADPAGALRSE